MIPTLSAFDIAWWFMTFPGSRCGLTVLAFNSSAMALQDG